MTKSSISRDYAHSKYEIFDYPGEYLESKDGDQYVAARLDELQSEYERVDGESDTRGFMSGGLFELEDFPRADQNREYLLVSVTHEAHVSGRRKRPTEMRFVNDLNLPTDAATGRLSWTTSRTMCFSFSWT